MQLGYVYILENARIPNIVKIGYTEREPATRAEELSSPTGVPGRWEVNAHWFVESPHKWEQVIFGELSSLRIENGEFFSIGAVEAKIRVGSILLNCGAIDESGQSKVGQLQLARLQRQEQQASERLEIQRKRDAAQVQWRLEEYRHWEDSLELAERELGVRRSDLIANTTDWRHTAFLLGAIATSGLLPFLTGGKVPRQTSAQETAHSRLSEIKRRQESNFKEIRRKFFAARGVAYPFDDADVPDPGKMK